MASDFRQKTQELAGGYRDFWNEHSNVAMALGFVPVVGTVLGIADAVAAHNDERASGLEKTLATAGILPFGKAAGLLKGALGGAGGPVSAIIGGPLILKRAREADKMDEFLTPHYDPDLKTEVAEFRRTPRAKQQYIDATNTGGTPYRTMPYSQAVENDPLVDIMPEVGDVRTSYTRVQNPGSVNPDNRPLNAGEGGFRWGPEGTQPLKGATMEIGTGTGGRPIAHADYEEIDDALVHESSGHMAQAIEASAGNWPKSHTGANMEKHGIVGYFGDSGEIGAEGRLRRGWTDASREELLPWQHRRGMLKQVEENIKSGKPPNFGLSAQSNPRVAREWAARAEAEPPSESFVTAVTRREPNWNTKPKKRVAGSWIDKMEWRDVTQLEPSLGQKLKAMYKDKSISARYEGDKVNHARKMALGEQVEPVRAKVRWDDTDQTLEVEELDGLRRVMAAKNLFGDRREGNLVPIIFEPADEVAATMAKDPRYRMSLRPAIDKMMADDKLHKPDVVRQALFHQGY